MELSDQPPKWHSKLPYNGQKLEFLAKNMRIPVKRVLDVL
jgi:hypothetical protein